MTIYDDSLGQTKPLVLTLKHYPSDNAGMKHLNSAVLYQSNVHFLHVPKHIFNAKYSVFRGSDVVG